VQAIKGLQCRRLRDFFVEGMGECFIPTQLSQWFVTPSALDAEPWGGARTDPSRLSNGFAYLNLCPEVRQGML